MQTTMVSARSSSQTLRRVVLVMSAALLAVGLYRIGKGFYVNGSLRFGNPVTSPGSTGFDDMGAADPQPRRVRAEVTRVRGHQSVRVSDRCEFLVERRPLEKGAFYCNAQVLCGGKLVYGGPDRGFFACKLYSEPRRDVVGADNSTTGVDHDAGFSLDTRAGIMRVWDDARGREGAFEIEADVIDVE